MFVTSANIYRIAISFVIVDALQANTTITPAQEITSTKSHSKTIHQVSEIGGTSPMPNVVVDSQAANANQAVNITRMMIEAKIVPEMIRYAPTEICRVFYRDGEVQPGSVWNFTKTTYPPLVTWPAEPNSTYFLYFGCVQRYVPYEPYEPRWFHDEHKTPRPGVINTYQLWVVNNIPGNDTMKGNTLYYYHSPKPTRGRAANERFVFLVYKQRERRIDIGYVKLWRAMLDKEIANCDNMTVIEKKYPIGKPVAGNFFRSISTE